MRVICTPSVTFSLTINLNFIFPLKEIFFENKKFNESDFNNFWGYGSYSQISQIEDCKFHQKVMTTSRLWLCLISAEVKFTPEPPSPVPAANNFFDFKKNEFTAKIKTFNE